ncbi:hypothetical protein [Blastomonas sp. AAP25]|nr:hypothetical protein [Blastomonas sp. AAP25]
MRRISACLQAAGVTWAHLARDVALIGAAIVLGTAIILATAPAGAGS